MQYVPQVSYNALAVVYQGEYEFTSQAQQDRKTSLYVSGRREFTSFIRRPRRPAGSSFAPHRVLLPLLPCSVILHFLGLSSVSHSWLYSTGISHTGLSRVSYGDQIWTSPSLSAFRNYALHSCLLETSRLGPTCSRHDACNPLDQRTLTSSLLTLGTRLACQRLLKQSTVRQICMKLEEHSQPLLLPTLSTAYNMLPHCH